MMKTKLPGELVRGNRLVIYSSRGQYAGTVEVVSVRKVDNHRHQILTAEGSLYALSDIPIEVEK